MRIHILTTVRHDGRIHPAGRKADLPEEILPALREIGAVRDLTEDEQADEAALIGGAEPKAETGSKAEEAEPSEAQAATPKSRKPS